MKTIWLVLIVILVGLAIGFSYLYFFQNPLLVSFDSLPGRTKKTQGTPVAAVVPTGSQELAVNETKSTFTVKVLVTPACDDGSCKAKEALYLENAADNSSQLLFERPVSTSPLKKVLFLEKSPSVALLGDDPFSDLALVTTSGAVVAESTKAKNPELEDLYILSVRELPSSYLELALYSQLRGSGIAQLDPQTALLIPNSLRITPPDPE